MLIMNTMIVNINPIRIHAKPNLSSCGDNEDNHAVCTIKNLDIGKEFVGKEVNTKKVGTLNHLIMKSLKRVLAIHRLFKN